MNIKNDIIKLMNNPLCVIEKYKHNGLVKYRVYIKQPRGGDVMKPTIQDVMNKLDVTIQDVMNKLELVNTNLSNRIDSVNTNLSNRIQKNTDMIQNLIVKNDLKI